MAADSPPSPPAALAGVLDLPTGLIDDAPVGIALFDEQARYLYVNRHLADVINGVPVAEHLGRTPREVLPDIPGEATETIVDVARDGEDAIGRMVRGRTRTGGERHIRVHFYALEYAGRPATGVVAEDVTEQAEAEAEVARGRQLLRDVLDSMPAQVAVVDRAGAITAVNRAWRAFAADMGSTAETPDWLATNYLDVCAEATGPEGGEARAAADGIRRVIEGTDAHFQLEYPCHAPDRLRWFVMHAATLTDGDGAVILHHDITERRMAELELGALLERVRRLDRLGQEIDRALMPEQIAEVVARQVSEALDAPTLVRLAPARGEGAVACTAAVTDADERTLAGLVQERAHPLAAPPGRDPALVDLTSARHRAFGDDDPFAAAAAGRLGRDWVAHVPMLFDRLPIGTVTAFLDGTRDQSAALELLTALSTRAAPSLKAARQYRRRERASAALQRGLLPGPLPPVPGLEVATAYRPGTDHLEVGGDFFDVFEVEGGWMTIIGDVSGKGADAAPRSAAARQTLRVAAGYDPDPVALLRTLDGAIAAQQGDRPWFCTATALLLQPVDDGWEVHAASGGHPSVQLRRADGGWSSIPARGSLLGALSEPRFEPAVVRLSAGDLLLAYTDGIPDAGAPERVLDAQDIAAVCGSCPTARHAVDAVVEAAMDAAGRAPRDDLAIVALRVPDAGARPPLERPPAGS